MENNYIYCKDINKYQKFETREVQIGDIPLGGNNPIRIQSMTTTDTLDTEKSVEQCIRVFDAGADYVRLTAQSARHADNLAEIKKELVKRGYTKPLIADIHFNPKVAEIAAELVEKVRVNPGNFVDRKNGKQVETEEEYNAGLAKIDEQFSKLIGVCKNNKTAIRIGANHGSLSSRIVNRYGDTSEGMAQSVLEFLRIAQKNDFHNLVISIKASNTRVMVYAYRVLMKKMITEGMNYPLHLGVTEAGDGEDGRIKSSIGIGTMLADGIGDTVRVSLTEDPEKEIPVAKKIVDYSTKRENSEEINEADKLLKSPFEYSKRKTYNTTKIGSEKAAVVIADLSENESIIDADLIKLGFKLDENKQWLSSDTSPDYIFSGDSIISTNSTQGVKFICSAEEWEDKIHFYPFFPGIREYEKEVSNTAKMKFVVVNNTFETIEKLKKLKDDSTIILMLESNNLNPIADQRAFMQHLIKNKLLFPVVLKKVYIEADFENFQIHAACDIGPMLIDGYIDGLMLSKPSEQNCTKIVNTSFAILQAGRTRMTKTEFISCPSCGRTLFEIQKVTAKVKKRTGHLKGLKIAVMGCIVNGPGEMADADYGYVGAGAGKVSLYKGQEVVKKNIASENAIDELVDLIKEKGDWKVQV